MTESYTIVGKSYLNYLLGHKILDEEKSIQLIEDEDFGIGENYSCKVFELEKQFLKTWGEDEKLDALKNIEETISNKPIEFAVPGLRILLGRNPSENIGELIRKAPQFFYDEKDQNDKIIKDILKNSELFDLMYNRFCHLVAANIFRYKSFQNLIIEDFLIHCPQHIQTLYKCFLEKWFKISKSLKKENVPLKNLMYLLRANIHNKICLKTSDFEVFHLFLCLLSPRYEINDKQLRSSFNWPKNVEVIKGKVDDLNLRFSKVKTLDVDNKEFPTKNIFFVTSKGREDKLDIPFKYRTYINLKLTGLKSNNLRFLKEHTYVYGSNEKLGTRFPFWQMKLVGKELVFDMIVEFKNGTKEEFFLKKVKEILAKDLKFIWGDIDINFDDIQATFGNELYYCDGTWQEHKRDELARIPISRKFKVYSAKKNKFIKSSNSYYFGPLKDGPLGLLSLLMELKDSNKLMGK